MGKADNHLCELCGVVQTIYTGGKSVDVASLC